jgi:NADH dehydrogenase
VTIHCLVHEQRLSPELSSLPRVVETRGDLHDPSSYERALEDSDVIVHLAARTGRGSFPEHERANTIGTRVLLEACARAGGKAFLYVSTIAVVFPEKKHYPYARSKEEAERLVRASGLDWVIVRPTIVLGKGSPLWPKFLQLASAPVMLVPDGGKARVNPVHVEDVAIGIDRLLQALPWKGATIELGGRDVLTMDEFLKKIRRAVRGREGRVAPIPARRIIGALGALEGLAGRPLLPVAAGQFYAFRYDSVAAFDESVAPPLAERRGIDEMIREIANG